MMNQNGKYADAWNNMNLRENIPAMASDVKNAASSTWNEKIAPAMADYWSKVQAYWSPPDGSTSRQSVNVKTDRFQFPQSSTGPARLMKGLSQGIIWKTIDRGPGKGPKFEAYRKEGLTREPEYDILWQDSPTTRKWLSMCADGSYIQVYPV